MRTRQQVLVPVVIALSIAGCGGSSNSNTASTGTGATADGTTTHPAASTASGGASGTPYSAPRLVVTADGICKRLNEQLEATKTVVSTTQDVARVTPQRAAMEQKALSELSKLTPPASLASDYQQLLTSRRTLAEDTAKVGEAVAAGDTSSEKAAYESGRLAAKEMVAASRKTGLKDCRSLA